MSREVPPELGVIVALPAEARGLGVRRVRIGSRVAIDAGGLIVSGIGQQRARAAAEQLVADGARLLLSWGVVGALVPELRAGDLFIPGRVLHSEGEMFPDARLCARLIDALSGKTRLHRGTLWSSADAILSATARQALARRSGAVAVDMESAAVAAVAARAGLPFIAVKAVCDPAERNLPAAALTVLTGDGRLSARGVVGAVFGGPAVWRDLRALGRDFAAARETLAAVAPLTLPRLYLDDV